MSTSWKKPAEEPVRRLTDGDVIFREGRFAASGFVIKFGEVELFKRIRGRDILIDVHYAGELIGWEVAVDGEPLLMSARAVGAVELKSVSNDTLKQKLGLCDPVIRRIVSTQLANYRLLIPRLAKAEALVIENNLTRKPLLGN